MTVEMRKMILARDLRIAVLEEQVEESRRKLSVVVARCKQSVAAVRVKAEDMLERCWRQMDLYESLAARLLAACKIADELRPIIDMSKVYRLQRDRLTSLLASYEDEMTATRQQSAAKEKRLVDRLDRLHAGLQVAKDATTTIKWQQDDYRRYMQMMIEVILHRLSLHRCRRPDDHNVTSRVDGRLSMIEDRYRHELADIIRTDTMNKLT